MSVFNHCQWIYGEGDNRRFCDQPTYQPPHRECKSAWCKNHYYEVYTLKTVKKTSNKTNRNIKQRAAA